MPGEKTNGIFLEPVDGASRFVRLCFEHHEGEITLSLTEQEGTEKPQLEATPIYRCKDPGCKAWVREEFLPGDKACPLCKGPMLKSIKHLPPSGKPKKKAKRPAARASR